jgi:hypothetical protein
MPQHRCVASKSLTLLKSRSKKAAPKSVHIKKRNYSFLTKSRIQKEEEPMLEISIKLEEDQPLGFLVIGDANCKHLLEIYKKHFAPLFAV